MMENGSKLQISIINGYSMRNGFYNQTMTYLYSHIKMIINKYMHLACILNLLL